MKAAESARAAPRPFAQVTAQNRRKCPQLPKLRHRLPNERVDRDASAYEPKG
jgi:hypothetical protein